MGLARIVAHVEKSTLWPPKFTYTTVRRRNCGEIKRHKSSFFLQATGKAGVTNINTQNATAYAVNDGNYVTGGNSVPRAVPQFSLQVVLSSRGPSPPNAEKKHVSLAVRSLP